MRVRRSKRSSRFKHQPDVNLNSFLDLILNVLLFFVFATEIAAFQAIEVTVPTSNYANKETLEKSEMIIYISGDNRLNVDGQFLDKDELEKWLVENKKENTFVIVRGDLQSNLQSMIDVLSACRAAKIDKVKVETKASETN